MKLLSPSGMNDTVGGSKLWMVLRRTYNVSKLEQISMNHLFVRLVKYFLFGHKNMRCKHKSVNWRIFFFCFAVESMLQNFNYLL